MRRAVVFLLTLAMLAAGAAAVDAKPRKKSPRLHAFRSCANLLGYAQRNGLRVVRESPVRLLPPPQPVAGGDEGVADGGGGTGGQDRAVAPVAAPAPASGEGTSQTNVQEAGVDEPDWVKAAGTTLYVVKQGKLRAIDAGGDRPDELGAIEVPGHSQELLVRGDRALVITTLGSGPIAFAAQVPAVPPARWLGKTRLMEVDISDPAKLRVLRELDIESFSGLGTLTVLTLDMQRGLPAVDADALMTDGDTVYASEDRLYVASERWLPDDAGRAEILSVSATGLHAFSTEKAGGTSYVGSGEIPGYLLNQWSLSEHEGTLRAATTSMPPFGDEGGSESAVRTLQERDGRLVQVGAAGGLGKGERIYAVRFMGDTGFVVTFRQTDPLYTLDLGDPRRPRVVGELKVPGYSAYLHPIGDGLLLGVGQDATEEGRRTGVQLSLFDVSDLADPVRLHQFGLGENSYTPVEYDHHAFLWWGPRKLAVIPAYRYAEKGGSFAGALAFTVDRAGIADAGRMAHPAFERFGRLSYDRAVVVGGRLLLLSEEGVLATALAAPGPGEFMRYGG
jgi:Beta propeller domain